MHVKSVSCTRNCKSDLFIEVKTDNNLIATAPFTEREGRYQSDEPGDLPCSRHLFELSG